MSFGIGIDLILVSNLTVINFRYNCAFISGPRGYEPHTIISNVKARLRLINRMVKGVITQTF